MKIDVSSELEIRTSRSGGKGGQNVNKVETQVEARFNISKSSMLHPEQITILLEKMHGKLSKEGILIVRCNESRTQLDNKAKAIAKMNQLIELNLKKRKTRLATKIPKGINEKRIKVKKIRSEIKRMRGSTFE